MIFALIIHLSSGASSSSRKSSNDTCWRELKHFDEDGGAWKRVDPPCSDDRMHKCIICLTGEGKDYYCHEKSSQELPFKPDDFLIDECKEACFANDATPRFHVESMNMAHAEYSSNCAMRKVSNGCQIKFNYTIDGKITMVGSCNWLDSKLETLTFLLAASFAIAAMLIIILVLATHQAACIERCSCHTRFSCYRLTHYLCSCCPRNYFSDNCMRDENGYKAKPRGTKRYYQLRGSAATITTQVHSSSFKETLH